MKMSENPLMTAGNRLHLSIGQHDHYDAKEDGKEDDLKHQAVVEGQENVRRHHVHKELEWPVSFLAL